MMHWRQHCSFAPLCYRCGAIVEVQLVQADHGPCLVQGLAEIRPAQPSALRPGEDEPVIARLREALRAANTPRRPAAVRSRLSDAPQRTSIAWAPMQRPPARCRARARSPAAFP